MTDSDSDAGEIKLNNQVFNQDYEVSDDESEVSSSCSEDMGRERLNSIDEETEENANVLRQLLLEVADTEAVGRNSIKVSVFNKNKKMLGKKEKIDFEINESGYPFIPCDCEEYLWHFLEEMKDVRPELKGTRITTNMKNFKYKF